MEIRETPCVKLVGLGYGGGRQVTLQAHSILLASTWIGHFGLTISMKRFLATYHAPKIDLDLVLQSAYRVAGFTVQAVNEVINVAMRLGQATVAVTGHPSFGSPFARTLVEMGEQLGVFVEVVGAPSILDNLGHYPKLLSPHSGVAIVDARYFLRLGSGISRSIPWVVLNGGYLDGLERYQFGILVRKIWDEIGFVVLYKSGEAESLTTHPLGFPESWLSLVDYETTVLLLGETMRQ